MFDKSAILKYGDHLKPLARELRKAGNLSEALLWRRLRNKQLYGLDFDRQKPIGDYIPDFYCKEKKIAIEIDGESHNYKQQQDIKRDEYLRKLGITVIRIPDIDIKQRMDAVIYLLENHPALRPDNWNPMD